MGIVYWLTIISCIFKFSVLKFSKYFLEISNWLKQVWECKDVSPSTIFNIRLPDGYSSAVQNKNNFLLTNHRSNKQGLI